MISSWFYKSRVGQGCVTAPLLCIMHCNCVVRPAQPCLKAVLSKLPPVVVEERLSEAAHLHDQLMATTDLGVWWGLQCLHPSQELDIARLRISTHCYSSRPSHPPPALPRCIELAPDFVKGYSRKGALQYFMKEYDKAMATYEAGLKHDPDNQELKDGIMSCLQAIDRIAHGAWCSPAHGVD